MSFIILQNIIIIKEVSLDKSIINQKKIIKIFSATIILIGLTMLFWPFLIKRDKNFATDEEPQETKCFKTSAAKITLLLITIMYLFLTIYLLETNNWWHYLIFLLVCVSLDLVLNIVTIVSISRDKNFSNKKNVLKFLVQQLFYWI